MPNPSQRTDNFRNGLVLIDWNTGGHHQTYLREYVAAFSGVSMPILVMSPENPTLGLQSAYLTWREIPTIRWLKSHQRFGMAVARWRYAKLIAFKLRELEVSLGIRCSRVFFGCLYENQSKLVTAVMRAMALPAAGLYLQAGVFHAGVHRTRSKLALKVRSMLCQPLLDRIFMLDEAMMETVGSYSGKKVVLLPDITDCSTEEHDALPGKLGIHPKSRPVLGLLGHLRPSKGVAEMLSFARSVPELDATFLLAGSCRWIEFKPEEEEFIKRAIAEDPRIIFHPERISGETSYNALVKACDVLWAVYRDSPHSSNTLAKAAFFEKPMIVADGYLMGLLTRKYALGAVVDGNDADALGQALLPMLADTRGWLAAHPPRWEEFRKDHSNERFRDRLREWARDTR